jgi:hypothetical protein
MAVGVAVTTIGVADDPQPPAATAETAPPATIKNSRLESLDGFLDIPTPLSINALADSPFRQGPTPDLDCVVGLCDCHP